MTGSFANDISDRCIIAAVRNAKVPKTKPCSVIKCNMKAFVEQGFCHDLTGNELSYVMMYRLHGSFSMKVLSLLLINTLPSGGMKSKGEITHSSVLIYLILCKIVTSLGLWPQRLALRLIGSPNHLTFLSKNAKSHFYLSATTEDLVRVSPSLLSLLAPFRLLLML